MCRHILLSLNHISTYRIMLLNINNISTYETVLRIVNPYVDLRNHTAQYDPYDDI